MYIYLVEYKYLLKKLNNVFSATAKRYHVVQDGCLGGVNDTHDY